MVVQIPSAFGKRRNGDTQFVIATHSPILMTYPGASLLCFDGDGIAPTRLEDTTHFQIMNGILDNPNRYWKHLLAADESG